MDGAASSEVDDLFANDRADVPDCAALPKVGGRGMCGATNRFVKIALGGPDDKDVAAHAVYLGEPIAGTSALLYWQLRHFYFKMHGAAYLHIWIRPRFV